MSSRTCLKPNASTARSPRAPNLAAISLPWSSSITPDLKQHVQTGQHGRALGLIACACPTQPTATTLVELGVDRTDDRETVRRSDRSPRQISQSRATKTELLGQSDVDHVRKLRVGPRTQYFPILSDFRAWRIVALVQAPASAAAIGVFTASSFRVSDRSVLGQLAFRVMACVASPTPACRVPAAGS